MKKLLSLTLVLFSVIVFGSFSASAKDVNVGDYFELSYNKKNSEQTLTFTAKESIWYEIALDTPAPRDTYVSTYDASGKEIGFDFWDGTTSRCLSAVELVANQTYTFVITCETDSNVVVSGRLNKHAHDYQINNIVKADQHTVGSIEKECIICEHIDYFPIPKINIEVSGTSFAFNGKTQVPAISVTDTDGKVFANNTDYTVEYKKVGASVANDYEIVVVVKNDYYDTFKIVNYEIVPQDINNLTVEASAEKVVYGKKVTVKIAGLTKGKDFDYDASYNTIGKHTIVVEGKGNYTGTKTISYKVVPAKVSGLKVEKATASSIKLVWNADKNSKTEYYQIYDAKTKKTTTIKSDKLSYTIKSLKAGTAYSFKVRGYSKENGEKYYGDWTTITGITKPAATTLKSLKSEKAKAFIAKWTAKSGVTGYQIQYSTAADFSSAKTVKITKSATTSKTVSSLKSGKKYYVRIRTYKTLKVNGESKTVYSVWSSASSVKVK